MQALFLVKLSVFTKKRVAERQLVVLLGCGGSTRTNDLQVMSLASYQLLHPAMLLCGIVSQMRCKGTTFF